MRAFLYLAKTSCRLVHSSNKKIKAMPHAINLKHFTSLIENELNELKTLNTISHEGAETVELDQSKIGRLSRMDALQQQAMQVEQNRRRDLKIKQLQSALVRIQNDDYGCCLDCGEKINIKRLEISLATQYCTQCADKH